MLVWLSAVQMFCDLSHSLQLITVDDALQKVRLATFRIPSYSLFVNIFRCHSVVAKR